MAVNLQRKVECLSGEFGGSMWKLYLYVVTFVKDSYSGRKFQTFQLSNFKDLESLTCIFLVHTYKKNN